MMEEGAMRFGFVLPSGDARTAADFAHDAEQAGWDGFFVWESVWGIDAWVSLTAAAMRTERIRLGTMLTPLSRMRPWKLASETVTLDNLSHGRVILAVGLGAPDTGFAAFGEVTDRKTRAELLDEGLDILTGLWQGQPFNYSGKHYIVTETTFSPPPPPVQQPRIPIWVVGAWPRPKSMRHVLRYDGLLPAVLGDNGQARQADPGDIRALAAYIAANRAATTPFDIIVEGETPGDDTAGAATTIRPWADAGATWWLETRWNLIEAADSLDQVRERIRQGPPRLGA
jgi:alkanesulfonate monooxygenase SsuD/methylene tetrahydromethanopterin reductase-like flavin-dependent oxidoreductase (luciferase family)